MYESDIHHRAKELMSSSLVPSELQESYISILPFLSEEKIKEMIQKLEKAKLLMKKINL